MNNDGYNYYPSKEDESNFRELLDGYLKYWYWFLAAVLVALACAFLYLKFTLPTYVSVSTIIIEDEEGKGPSSSSSSFADIGILNGLSTSSIENELGLLRSKRLMTNAVTALNLNIQYYEQDSYPERELYKESPLLLRLIRLNEKNLPEAVESGKNQFSLREVGKDKIEIKFSNQNKVLVKNIGDIIELDHAEFVVERNKAYRQSSISTKEGVLVKFTSIASAVSSYQGSLEVELVDDNSTLIRVSMVDNVKLKSQDILNQLIFQYNQEAIEDKNLIARNTAFFIDERLNIINSELDSVETGKEQFKEVNSLTDIQAESSLIIQNASVYNDRQQDVNTQLQLTDAMIQHMNSNDSNLLPTNLGINESGTTQLIDEFNTLVLERNRLLEGAGEQNPRVLSLNDRIQQIKSNVQVSLERRQSNLLISRDNLRRQAGILGSQIAEVPGQERQFRGIERQQNIKEALYLFLLRKREENSLSLASKPPKAKLVDEAYSLNAPISPNSKIIFGIAILAGLFFPFLIINVVNLLNNKVRDNDDLKKLAKSIPIIGEIPHVSKKGGIIVKGNERSVLSEAFSIISANLQYVNNGEISKTKGTCIYVTSSVKGEGKTFSAMNLSMTFALAGKKVLIVGGDLRNPQLHRFEKSKTVPRGLSDFLSEPNKDISEFILDSTLHPNLKLLHSGTIPPNPPELLRKPELGELFGELKMIYDYIIVDTAPSILVADTFLISKYADLTLYLVRAGYSKNKVLEFAIDAEKDGKLKNMGFLLNDVKSANSSYGYAYGYN